MLNLTEKRFSDFFRDRPETGMGHWIVTVVLKDGRAFPQTAIVGGSITQVRHHKNIPFSENEIDHLDVTHEKWDWSESVADSGSR
jgi:hypothetical protein